MAKDPLKAKYDQAFQYIESGQSSEKSGDLRSSYNMYMAGIELFMTIYKLEKNDKKKKILKSNLDSFMSKAESIKNEIKKNENEANSSGLQPYATPGGPNGNGNASAPPLNDSPYNPAAMQDPMTVEYTSNNNNGNNMNNMYNMNMGMNSMNNMNMNGNNNNNNNNNNGYVNFNPNFSMPFAMPNAPMIDEKNDDGNNNDGNDALAALNALDDLLPDPPGSKPKGNKNNSSNSNSNNNSNRNNTGFSNSNSNSNSNFNKIPSNEGDEPESDPTLDEAQKMLDKAIDFDTNKEYSDAVKFYTLASQLFLDAIQMNKLDAPTKKKTRDKVSTILGRLEILKKFDQKKSGAAAPGGGGGGGDSANKGIANESLSQMELEVLRRSSYIRSIVLYPWMEEDRHARFKFEELWKDKTG